MKNTFEISNLENPEKNKLRIDSSYEELESKIPEVFNMKGFDQKSDFHSLTLDEHVKTMIANLEREENINLLQEKTKSLVLLAGKLHDLGKMSTDGQQVHPEDPEKRQYIGHEKESEKIIRDILSKYFELSVEDMEFIAKLAGLHALALNLVNNFEKNNQPKGKELGAYDDFLKKVEEIPGDLSIIEKMKIVFSINRADKLAGYNEHSDISQEKVKKIMEGAENQVKTLNSMDSALPALLEAINARRNGNQKAGIIFENGEYKYKKEESINIEIPKELEAIREILKDKIIEVARVYVILKSKKGNEKALQGILDGVLKKKIGLSDEQIKAIIETLE